MDLQVDYWLVGGNRKDINKKKQEKMFWKKCIQNNDSLPSRPVKKKHNQGILHISMDVCVSKHDKLNSVVELLE